MNKCDCVTLDLNKKSEKTATKHVAITLNVLTLIVSTITTFYHKQVTSRGSPVTKYAGCLDSG